MYMGIFLKENMNEGGSSKVVLGESPVSLSQFVSVAQGSLQVTLDQSSGYQKRVAASVEVLKRALRNGRPIYGVNTGFGASCNVSVPPELISQLPVNLMRFHGCGTGRELSETEGAGVVLARLACISRGYSGVRMSVLEGLCELINRRVIPCIPEEGSVGASGDLTPLSYLVATLMGEREAYFGGERLKTADALKRAGLSPISLEPKESLALMNGTSVMTALGCLAYAGARRLARFAAALTAMTSDVLFGVKDHFNDRIFELKPHPGQRICARWIRDDTEYDTSSAATSARLQDFYSVRCAPHVIGVLLDLLPLAREILENELNSVNDNPILDPVSEQVLVGGNFYGGHVCFVMDSLKTAVANIADLLDRQLILACNPATNAGLPADLVGAPPGDEAAHFGFKAMQITSSALTAEALKTTMPASVFSRSTENHNQDKVSMGTIAARDCARVIELAETVASISLISLCQAADLRNRSNCHRRTLALHEAVREKVSMNEGDRRMDTDIDIVLEMLRSNRLPIGEIDFP